jgi:hypothetical protein
MKKNKLQKIIAGVAVFIVVFATSEFMTPVKAHAQWSVLDIPGDISEVLTDLSGAITSTATLGEEIQDSTLNTIATAIAKQLLIQITSSVVTWVNSGFNGNPAFVQNPQAFFQNVGDQATGAFISSNSALSSLCSPFSLQIRLALAQQQQKNDGVSTGQGTNQYSCTLSTVIQNGENAAKNSSINGFTGGDFSQGGWAAFAALTTQPQNNPNGAYLMAEDDLQQKISAQQTEKQNQLNQGNGFLSWESCTKVSQEGDSGPEYGDGSSDDNGDVSAGDATDPYGAAAENDPNQNCQIQTPGSVISAALNYHLAAPTDVLELADSINDIINAAFSQLIVQSLQKGLASVSKPSSSSGGNSYLQTVVASSNSQSFSTTQKSLLKTITPYLATASAIDQNYSAALGLISTASSTIVNAELCYQSLPNSGSFVQQISNLQTLNMTVVAPLFETILPSAENASSTDAQYQTMDSQITSAQTLSDLTVPDQTLTDLSESGNLPTKADIQTSQNDLSTTTIAIKPAQTQATNALQQCQSMQPPASSTPSQ